ncbi:M48 family metalloprotease [Leptolyngbya cf. ectocarpi LEGE 11479]|uniref:M48 family metalloprotease n=1 Tax=Leptolyngbya cf. ectocarpi LEGE 11479 TaxID=1828722 RepID=A0A929A020_LEPEC|nr:M48 family metallopeptidase [Leptolyngbya ectocarpi]MBE9070541.1 M48 family metalloprotease [Leptolyngbya cf. ectocarpi LEGE 11479]
MNIPRTTYRPSCRRWLYAAWVMIFGLGTVWVIPPVKADLIDLIFQGIRIIQISNLSDQEEIELGQQINQQILQDVNVYDNANITQYVDGIGQQLVLGTERRQIPYTFRVIEDDEVNAFATLGGFVYLNTGLLQTADNEAQLASVIAHEIAHIDRRHAVQRLQQAAIAQGILTAGGLEQNAAIALGVELALHRPNSRTHELEADESGLALHTQAGYAPIAAVDFLQKLLDESNATPEFLSTHPHPEARIDALNERLDPATASTGKGLDGVAYRDRIGSLP